MEHTFIVYNNYERITMLSEFELPIWLRNEGLEYDSLRIIKDTGNYTDLVQLEDGEWDIIDRGLDIELILERKSTFKDYSRKKTTSMDRKIKKTEKDKPMDQQKHMMKASRGLDRKRQAYVPMYKQLENRDTLPTAENVLKNAKSASSGAWKLSKRQVMEIANKYKFNIPNETKKTKHLGSTGILMWRKTAKDYYLVKFSKHHLTHTPVRKKRRK